MLHSLYKEMLQTHTYTKEHSKAKKKTGKTKMTLTLTCEESVNQGAARIIEGEGERWERTKDILQ